MDKNLILKTDETKEKISEVLGISDEREQKLLKDVDKSLRREENITLALKKVIDQTQTLEEAVFATFQIGAEIGYNKGFSKSL